jgi:6-phosphofructokinase 1
MGNEKNRGKLAILVGGPAPGIDGVISAATIECINQGFEVAGRRGRFRGGGPKKLAASMPAARE